MTQEDTGAKTIKNVSNGNNGLHTMSALLELRISLKEVFVTC